MRFEKQLVKLLENKAILKIGADVAGDIRSLLALRRFRPGGFVDLQQLAPDWGIEEKSLRKLSAIVLGKRVSKAQRLSNDRAVEEHGRQLCGIFVRYVLLKRSFFHANSLRRRKVID